MGADRRNCSGVARLSAGRTLIPTLLRNTVVVEQEGSLRLSPPRCSNHSCPIALNNSTAWPRTGGRARVLDVRHHLVSPRAWCQYVRARYAWKGCRGLDRGGPSNYTGIYGHCRLEMKRTCFQRRCHISLGHSSAALTVSKTSDLGPSTGGPSRACSSNTLPLLQGGGPRFPYFFAQRAEAYHQSFRPHGSALLPLQLSRQAPNSCSGTIIDWHVRALR